MNSLDDSDTNLANKNQDDTKSPDGNNELTEEELKKIEKEAMKREVLEMLEEAQREEQDKQRARTEKAMKEKDDERKRNKGEDVDDTTVDENKPKEDTTTDVTNSSSKDDEHLGISRKSMVVIAGKLRRRATTIKLRMTGKEDGINSSSTPKKITSLVKEGFLKKRGHLRKSWKTRWFALKLDGFYYYGDSSDTVHKGHISTIDITGVESVTSNEELEKLKAPAHILSFFLFKVITSRTEYYVAATTVEDRDEWVKLGNDVLLLFKDKDTKYNSL